jgi:hypothetical protein
MIKSWKLTHHKSDTKNKNQKWLRGLRGLRELMVIGKKIGQNEKWKVQKQGIKTKQPKTAEKADLYNKKDFFGLKKNRYTLKIKQRVG